MAWKAWPKRLTLLQACQGLYVTSPTERLVFMMASFGDGQLGICSISAVPPPCPLQETLERRQLNSLEHAPISQAEVGTDPMGACIALVLQATLPRLAAESEGLGVGHGIQEPGTERIRRPVSGGCTPCCPGAQVAGTFSSPWVPWQCQAGRS